MKLYLEQGDEYSFIISCLIDFLDRDVTSALIYADWLEEHGRQEGQLIRDAYDNKRPPRELFNRLFHAVEIERFRPLVSQDITDDNVVRNLINRENQYAIQILLSIVLQRSALWICLYF